MTSKFVLVTIAAASLAPGLGCSLKAKFLGGGGSSPSSPGSSASDASEVGEGASDVGEAGPAPAGSGRTAGVFEPGAIVYRDGRLHFRAWAMSPAAPVIRLRRGGKVLGEVALVKDSSWEEVFTCQGVRPDRTNGSVSLDEACSIAAKLEPASYELELAHGKNTMAKLAFQVVASVDMAGTKSMVVRPKDRNGHIFLDSGGVVLWHRVDIRDQVESLQFVWMNGSQVDAVRGALAIQKKIYWDETPVVDVVPVGGSAPETSWGGGGGSLRLLVFRNGEELLASFRIGDVLHSLREHGKLATLVPATDISDAQRKAAREAAMDEQGVAERSGSDGFDVAWPEDIACAVAQHKDARDALIDAVRGIRGSAMDREEARDLDRDAEEGLHTSEQRRKMKETAANKREGARRVAAQGSEGEKKLEKMARKYKPGCLAKIAPIE